MIRPSFVPPPEIRRLRDVTRYRIDLVETRTAEKQRVEKLLEDAQIKAVGGGLGYFRGVGAGDDGRADRRADQPQGVGAVGPRSDARQDRGIGFERLVDLLPEAPRRAAVAVLADVDIPPARALTTARELRGQSRRVVVIRRAGKLGAQLRRLQEWGFTSFVHLRADQNGAELPDERPLS